MDILIAQIIGVIAFLFFISSIQLKNKSKLLIFQLLANFLYGLSYLLLLAPTASFMSFISVIRCYLFFIYEEKGKKIPIIILIIIIGLILTVEILTFNNYLSLIPISIAISYTISTWQDNLKIVRIVFLVAAFFWIFYNISIGAYTLLIGNAFEIISGILSLIRFKKKH